MDATFRRYRKALRNFDRTTCEALATGQGSANRYAKPTVGLSTHVFGRICAHSTAILCAVPNSRWINQRPYAWDISVAAGHARSILEGSILFRYLITAPIDDDTQRAYVQLMHPYDCCKRIKILPHILPAAEMEWFKQQKEEITARLKSTQFFIHLTQTEKKAALSGSHMMFISRAAGAQEAGLDKATFEFFWNYFSQYTHVFFYAILSN